MTNKYFKIAKKTTIDYIENRIIASEFKKTFQKLDEIEIYKDLEKNGYKGVSNYISAISEIDDQNTLESQWIVEIMELFYAYFTDDYGYIYSKDLYKFLKFGLSKEDSYSIKTSFIQAIQSYLNKKISDYCLAYIANEFLNNLKFFEKEIDKDKELFKALTSASKLKPNKLLEDLIPEEIQVRQTINNSLKEYLKNNLNRD